MSANPICLYLRRQREKQGISYNTLAKMMGCSSSSLFYWEHGSKTPSLDNACRWARALGMDLVVLNDMKVYDD